MRVAGEAATPLLEKKTGGHKDERLFAMFTSRTEEWETPQELFDKLDGEFGFNMDVCASATNTKCESFFSKEDNALLKRWKGVCWMNPPYGKKVGRWVKKAYESSLEGATVVCLIPARTDTAWWHDYCMKGEIRFIRGRIRFSGHAHNAPFPSAVVIFRGLCRQEEGGNR